MSINPYDAARAERAISVAKQAAEAAKNETLMALLELDAERAAIMAELEADLQKLTSPGAQFGVLSGLVEGTMAAANEAVSLLGKVFGVFGFMDCLLVVVTWVLYVVAASVVVRSKPAHM